MEESDKNKIREPETAYSASRKITIYQSFEEADEAQLTYWAGLSPEERLTDFFNLMERFYTFQKPEWKGTKINIDIQNGKNAET